MRKIEGHFHLGIGGYSLETLIKYLDKHNYEQCWLLSWEELNPAISSLYKHLSIEDILDAHRLYPNRIVPFYAPDPATENLEEVFKDYIQKGVKGCGELKVSYKWSDAAIASYLSVLNQFKLPLIFHMELPRSHYVKVDDSFLERALDALLNKRYNRVLGHYIFSFLNHLPIQRISKHIYHFPGYLYDFYTLEQHIKNYPNITFIGHGPLFWASISSRVDAKYTHPKGNIGQFGIIDHLLTYDNMFCDISGNSGYNALIRDPKMGKRFIEKHYKKMIFGTDNSIADFNSLLYNYGLNKTILEHIYFNNAKGIIP